MCSSEDIRTDRGLTGRQRRGTKGHLGREYLGRNQEQNGPRLKLLHDTNAKHQANQKSYVP